MSQWQCYYVTSKKRVTKLNATARSSEIFARPDVARRVEFLRFQAEKGSKPATNTVKTVSKQGETVTGTGRASMSEIENALSQALRNGTTADKVSAAKQLVAMMPDNDNDAGAPDPSIFTAWLASIAGSPGPDIVREIGGVRFVADRICAALNMSRDELKAML